MTTITIDTTGNGTYWLYSSDDWKDYVCENFDENVVLTGNRNFTEVKEASWYKDVADLAYEFDQYYDIDADVINEIADMYKEYTPAQIENFASLYNNARSTDDVDFIANAAMVLHPELHLDTATLRGYSQGGWQEAIYVTDNVDPDTLETFYFGKIADVFVEDSDGDSYGDIITDDELWDLERSGNLKEEFRSRYNIPDDEELVVRVSDGYTRTPKYKEY